MKGMEIEVCEEQGDLRKRRQQKLDTKPRTTSNQRQAISTVNKFINGQTKLSKLRRNEIRVLGIVSY